MSSKLTIYLITVGVYLVAFGIFMLYQNAQHKKRMKEIDAEWEERQRRWQLEEHDRRWRRMEREEYEEWIRRSAMVPYDEVKRTDKLSPPKKMGKHTMR